MGEIPADDERLVERRPLRLLKQEHRGAQRLAPASIPELASLIDPTQSNPSLPTGHPFQDVQTVQNDFYWSATTVAATPADQPSRAWTVRFMDGIVIDIDKSSPDPAWCVRGGMNAVAY